MAKAPHRARTLVAALAAGVLLCITAAAAIAAPSPLLDQDAVVEPKPAAREAPASPPTTAPEPATPTTPTPTPTTPQPPAGEPSTTTTTLPIAPPPVAPQTLRTDPGAGSAAAQPLQSKRAEARAACTPQRPPVNEMLAIGGVVGSEEGSPWSRVALFVAACFAAIGLVAFLARRRADRHSGAPPATRGLLETISGLVAIAGTLIAIAGQFISEPPAAEAQMAVRDVLPRITRSEYARRTGTELSEIRTLDRREVGNVVLLEIRLQGYRRKRLELQYATYSLDREVRGTLLHGTDRSVGLRVADDDTQISFVPIWVGYPKSEKFEAQFRLIEDLEIRQLTSTGPMKGSTYRYACSQDARAV